MTKRPADQRDGALLGIAAEHPELVDYLDGLQRRIEALEHENDDGWARQPLPEDGPA